MIDISNDSACYHDHDAHIAVNASSADPTPYAARLLEASLACKHLLECNEASPAKAYADLNRIMLTELNNKLLENEALEHQDIRQQLLRVDDDDVFCVNRDALIEHSSFLCAMFEADDAQHSHQSNSDVDNDASGKHHDGRLPQ
ncbi:hypothetical protein CYMTET_22369 [Cymbomonas tetramitiformis]|uniref:Uncharacterized protein n=1 Tax=Cymbomonas tetramitiformis TaxID=36881 RepID=A0AAE0G0J2_9CHLO|nr:hypothetical protein CYMTET_22369 [Cymbomonas tetramitiformis]